MDEEIPVVNHSNGDVATTGEPEDPEFSGSLDDGEDDEATLEEEESQENASDIADEIDELQRVFSSVQVFFI